MVSTFPPLKYSAKIHLRNFSAHAFGRNTPLPPKNSAWCKISLMGLKFQYEQKKYLEAMNEIRTNLRT